MTQFEKDKAEIEKLFEGATPGQYNWGQIKKPSRWLYLWTFFNILRKTPRANTGLNMVVMGEGDDQITIAITGNGPAGEANARLLANAPDAIRYLLDYATRVTENNRELMGQITRCREAMREMASRAAKEEASQ